MLLPLVHNAAPDRTPLLLLRFSSNKSPRTQPEILRWHFSKVAKNGAEWRAQPWRQEAQILAATMKTRGPFQDSQAEVWLCDQDIGADQR